MERRTVLKAGAALALTGAVGVPGWATPARAAAADLDRILANFVAVYTGTPADRSNANVARKVATIGTNAAARLRIMADPATLPTTATQLFTGVALGTAEASLTTTFSHLADIALATVTPGAPQYGDAALQRRVVAGIDWVRANRVLPAVANMSLGGGASTATDNATNNLINSGVTVVVAAGNNNANACNYSPARVANEPTV